MLIYHHLMCVFDTLTHHMIELNFVLILRARHKSKIQKYSELSVDSLKKNLNFL